MGLDYNYGDTCHQDKFKTFLKETLTVLCLRFQTEIFFNVIGVKSEIGVGLNLVGEKLKDFQISGLILSTSERNSPRSSNYEVSISYFREYLT